MENKYFYIIGGAVLGLGLLGLIIYAVVSGGRDEEKKQPTNEPITLTIWRLYENEDVFKPIFDDFRYDHPNITIVYEKKSVAEYEETITNAIAGGKGPDILSVPNDWLVKHKDKLVAAPDDLMTETQYKERFVDIASKDAVIDGKIYGMPLYADALALYYRREVMSEALTRIRQAAPDTDHTAEARLLTRPPATWDDLVAVVKLVTQRKGNDIATTGLAMGTADTTQNSAAILQALMLQNGAKMTNVDKSAASFQLPDKSQTGEPYYPGTEALDFYTAFAKTDRSVYNWNDRLGTSLEAFMNAKVAMMINFQFVQQDLKQLAPNLAYDVAALPQIKGSTAPVNVASYMIETVTKDSKHPREAWQLIKFMTEPRGASVFRSATRRPSAIRSQVEGNLDAFAVGIQSAQSIYKPDAKKYDEIFREMIKAVVDLKQPPQAAIDVAANRVTQLLLGK